MKNVRSLLAVVVVTAVLSVSADRAEAADPPSYLLLRPQAMKKDHFHGRGYHPGRAYGVSTHSYAYGWFGVPRRKQWNYSRGYRESYIQWQRR